MNYYAPSPQGRIKHMNKASTKKSNFMEGAMASVPLVVGAVPLALIFGALVVAQNLPIWFALLMSAFVFAGSAQFVVVGLMAVGSPLPVIILTTFIINLRHALYSIALVPYFKNESLLTRALIAFGLTDESFAILASRFGTEQKNLKYYYLGSMTLFYSCWVLASFAGALLGSQFPELKDMGLEIAMIVTFIGMVVPQMNTKPVVIGVITSSLLSICLASLPYNLGLVFSSLLGVATAYLYSKKRALTYG